jgi:glycosyltransferase involved in cell wall biosynthesis
MAAGLPVVGSDLPSATEFVGRQGAGILCQPENPDTFVTAIETLVRDRPRAREMGARGQRAFREHFSWESQMPALVNYYENILARRR